MQRSGYGQVGRGLSVKYRARGVENCRLYPEFFQPGHLEVHDDEPAPVEAGYSSFYVDREQRPFPYVPPAAISAIEVAGLFPGIAFRAPPASLDDAISAKLVPEAGMLKRAPP